LQVGDFGWVVGVVGGSFLAGGEVWGAWWLVGVGGWLWLVAGVGYCGWWEVASLVARSWECGGECRFGWAGSLVEDASC